MVKSVSQIGLKRKSPFAPALLGAFVILLAFFSLRPGHASDTAGGETPLRALSHFMESVQSRDHAPIFAALSESARAQMGNEARLVMKTLRLTYQALYNHTRYRILTESGAKDAPEGISESLIPVQLMDRKGAVTFALIHLVQADGKWRIDGMTLMDDTTARDM